MRKLVITCLFISASIGAIAQTLFHFGTNPVSKDEFLRVYQKNSINKKPDMSEKALREYLDLYSLFRMKVKEAGLQKLDTLPGIQNELNNYRKQLAKTYLTDEQVTNRLIREAYERMKEEVHVAHILILSSQTAPSADTVEPRRKIDSIYNALTKKKADFTGLAQKYSDDRGSKDRGGDIGYVTALQTIYPFEEAIYNTAIGKVSAPFRTQFGYHIVKVIDRRPAKGELKVAQILVAVQKSKGEEGLAAARKKIDSVKAELKNGVPFNDLVKKYSEDRFSINDNGVLPTFKVGDMTPAFEAAAFALKTPGEISEPVQTDYGFHIIKLIEKNAIKPFDSLQPQIKRKVDNDSRSQLARDMFLEKVKTKFGFKEYRANLDEVAQKLGQIPDTGKNANTFKASDYTSMTKPLFVLSGKEYTQHDFISYAEDMTRGRIMGPKVAVVNEIYTKVYVPTVVNDLEEHKLADEHADFKNLMDEYSDGIMLFELMDRNVWGKASKDTAGLKAFYETRKNKYMWEPGFTGAVYTFKNEQTMKDGLKLLEKKNVKDEDLHKKLHTDSGAHDPAHEPVTIQRGRYEFSKFQDFQQSALVKGKLTAPKKNADGTYTVVKVDDVFASPTSKSLDDARGYAIAEYQDYLEKQWTDELRRKYPVKVNEDVFRSLIK
jgi:peptidyl-prolyl cis-trans isomerase SurA